MLKPMLWLAGATLLLTPVQAAAAQFESANTRTGAFVGARFQMSLGGKARSKPRAALTIAPTLSRLSSQGELRTTIGEGMAFNFESRPKLTLAGVPADQALGLRSTEGVDAKHKLGLSKGGWIVIGVGVVAIAGGIYFLHEVRENSD